MREIAVKDISQIDANKTFFHYTSLENLESIINNDLGLVLEISA